MLGFAAKNFPGNSEIRERQSLPLLVASLQIRHPCGIVGTGGQLLQSVCTLLTGKVGLALRQGLSVKTGMRVYASPTHQRRMPFLDAKIS